MTDKVKPIAAQGWYIAAAITSAPSFPPLSPFP